MDGDGDGYLDPNEYFLDFELSVYNQYFVVFEHSTDGKWNKLDEPAAKKARRVKRGVLLKN